MSKMERELAATGCNMLQLAATGYNWLNCHSFNLECLKSKENWLQLVATDILSI
jgi:hypothetical protein